MKNDLRLSLSEAASLAKARRIPTRLASWANAQGIDLEKAIWLAMIELPAALEAVGETGDRRAVPILLAGLQSRNFFIVTEAATGLARLHERKAIKPIISASRKIPPDERPSIARTLLYFDDPAAQRAAEQMITDKELLARWREASRGFGVSPRR